MSKPLDEKRYLDIQKAADYTSLSTHSLYRRVSDRTIPFIKVGRLIRFDRQALDRWLDSKKEREKRTA